ncbi:MAG: formate dehydrogenase accessory sulfurtransferase FdhD [Dermatophilaceae bacterium]
MARVTRRRRVTRYAVNLPTRTREDVLAVEEPLQIRLGALPDARRPGPELARDLTVTMRTPGHDFDLVTGFLLGEGIIRGAGDIAMMRYCAGEDAGGQQTFNVIDVTLASGVPLPPASVERQVLTTSACGICGTTSIDDVRKALDERAGQSLAADDVRVPLSSLLRMPDELRSAQGLFERTGGVHAAGAFPAYRGEVGARCVREDVGRHNAVDKVLGWAAREGLLPWRDAVLQVSGRASFELVQKAAMAGMPVLAAVGAPSSLAVELADDVGLTLVGFSRGTSCNVYTHPGRIVTD